MYHILLLAAVAFGLRYDSPVSTEPICVNKNTISNLPNLPMTITRIAWPIMGPPFYEPLIVNNVHPISPPTVMCTQCDSPPCNPITICDAQSLFWNVEFNNLVVQPGLIELSDSRQLPPVLTVYYEPWGPMPTPTSTPPSVTPAAETPSATPEPR